MRSSTTEPTLYGLCGTNSGNGICPNIILDFTTATGEVITDGDWVVINASGYAAKNATTEARVHGVAMATVGSTLAGDGANHVPLLVWGVTDVDALVEDTDSASGYTGDIDVGQKLYIGEYTTGTGQYVVAGDGTNGVTANAVGTALDRVDGSTSADTTCRIRMFVDTLSGRE